MYFSNQPETLSRSDRRGLGSKNLNVRGDTYENVLFKSGLQNKGYSRTYDPNTKQGYKNATVDFTKSGGVPIEAKFGKFVPANLLAKSIRLSSDRYIEDFLSKKRFSGLANQMSATKLGEAQNTLSKMGYQNPDANLARTMGLSDGFIPNFMVQPHVIKRVTNSLLMGNARNKAILDLTNENWDKGKTLSAGSYEDWVKFVKENGFRLPENFQRSASYLQEAAKKLGSTPKGKASAQTLTSLYNKVKGLQGKTSKHAKFGSQIENQLATNFQVTPTPHSYPMDFTEDAAHRLSKSGIVSKSSLRLISEAGDATVISTGHDPHHFMAKYLGHLKNTKGPQALKDGSIYKTNFTNQELGVPFNDLIGKSSFQQDTVINAKVSGSHLIQRRKDLSGLVDPEAQYTLPYVNDYFNFSPFLSSKSSAVVSSGLIPNFSRNLPSIYQPPTKIGTDPMLPVIDRIVKKFQKGQITSQQATTQLFDTMKMLQIPMSKRMGYVDKLAIKLQGVGSKHGMRAGATDAQLASFGLIPNFSNPLQDAIQREANAGVPKSLIRVDQDNSLRSTQNPMGLAVTNTRDEPAGVKQGIQRAKQMGIDPKSHGSSSGFLPNFIGGAKNIGFGSGANSVNLGGGGGIKKPDQSGGKVEKAAEEAGGAMDGLMMKMFALTTVTYALEGAMGEAESGMTQFMKVTNATVMGLAQAGMVAGLGRETGKSLMAKGAKKSGPMGGLQKAGGLGMMALGPLGAAVAVAVPVFNALKENTTLLDSGLDTLRKSAEKTSKGIDALGSAMTAAEGIQDTRTKLVELDASAMSNTYQGEMKRLKLNAQLIKQQSELGDQAAQLGKHLNLSGKEIELMTSGTAQGMKKLQEAMLQAQKQMSVTSSMQQYIAATGYGDKDPLRANLQQLSLAQMTASSFGSKDDLKSSYESIISEVSSSLETLRNKQNKQIQKTSENDPMLSQMPSEAGTSTQKYDKEIKEELKERLSKNKDLNSIFKFQILSAIEGKMSLGQIKSFLKETEKIALEFKDTTEEQTNQAEVNLSLMREIANQRQRILNNLKIENIAYESQIKMAKMDQDYEAQKKAHQNNIIGSLELLSNKAMTDLKIQEKSQAITDDYNNKREAINREALQGQRDLIKDLFTTGGKFESAEMFADLRKAFTRTTINVATGESYDEKFEGGEKEAHKGQLETIRKNLVKAGEEQLAANLKGAENYQRANNITMDYLLNLKNQKQQAHVLLKLQEQGIIPENFEVLSLLQELSDIQSAKNQALEKEKALTIKNLDIVRKELEANNKGVEYAQQRAAEYEKQKIALGGTTGLLKAIEAKYYEEIDARNTDLARVKEMTQLKFQILSSEKYQKDLAQSHEKTIYNSLTTEMESLVQQGARLDAERKVKENTELFAKVLETKVRNEIKQLNEGASDDTDLLNEELKQGKFRAEANNNYITSQNNLTRQQEKFVEALKRGQFGLDALAEIQGAVHDLIKNMEIAKTQMAFYANQEGDAGTGNTIKGSEAALKYAQSQKELNIEQNKGTLFADSIAVKIAEANVEMARFGETLANTTFDAVQDGFKGFVNDMLSGTKSLGDAALGFAHGIVSKIHEQLLNRATSQITAGIFEGLGLGKPTSKQGGGIVSRYSTGGSVGRVPAMLTNGEYVVKKKIVDKLGVNDLNKINQTGSLEDLYNKPNENGFEMMNNGGLAMPPIIKLKEGGSIQNYLAKRDQSSDSGSQNERTIVDGEVINTLSNTIAKFMGGLAKFSFGGRVKQFGRDMKEASKNSLISDPNDSAGVKIAKGSGYLAGTVVGGYQGYEPQAYSGSAPVRVNPLNTRSMLNVDPSSRSMSARFRAQDDYSSKYGDYLLDKYQHDINQRNEKLKSRASMMQGIVNQIGMMGVMYGTEQAVRSAFQPAKRKEYHTSIDNSQVNAFRDYQINQQTKSDRFLNNNTSISQNNISSAYSIGGGNLFNNEEQFLKKNSGYSEGGKVHGPAGIDKVGPVMLDRGEFVIKASSVNKVEKQYPGFFDQLNTMKFNQGGVVDPSASSANVQNSEVTNNQSSSSNVTVNINVSAGGETTVNGGAGDQQAFASKIKEAVVNVISQEKRVGGMLR